MKIDRSRFYLIIASLLLLVVLLGFGPRFYLRPYFEQPMHMQMDRLPLAFVLHGVLMTLWYVLLVVQSALVNSRKMKLHMTLGWALCVVAVLAVAFAIPVMMGFAPRMLALGFLDLDNPDRYWFQNVMWTNDLLALTAFTGMIAVGVMKRTNKALHRTMMLFASMVFMGPALARMFEWMAPAIILTGSTVLFFLFPVAVVVHDWVKLRRFPAYPVIGLVILALVMGLSFALPSTALWNKFFLQHLQVTG